ncbi:hypothetical protein [Hydrogenivirga sp.]
MMKLLLSILLILGVALAQDRCREVSEYAVKCFKKKNSGELTSCERPRVGQGKGRLKELFRKACVYGCLSESLYEANRMAEIVYEECRSGGRF